MENGMLMNLKDFFISLSHLLDIGDEYLEYHQIRTAFLAWKIRGKNGAGQRKVKSINNSKFGP